MIFGHSVKFKARKNGVGVGVCACVQRQTILMHCVMAIIGLKSTIFAHSLTLHCILMVISTDSAVQCTTVWFGLVWLAVNEYIE